MDIQKIQQYKSAFDLIAKTVKDDDDNNIEVWYARELQEVLGYARWENFVGAVCRAIESCKTLGINVDDHFREVTKKIALAKGAQRDVQDFMLWRKMRRICRKAPRSYRRSEAKGHKLPEVDIEKYVCKTIL